MCGIMRYTTGIITDGGRRGSYRSFLTNKVNYSEQGTKSLYNRQRHRWRKPRGRTHRRDKFGQANSRVLRRQFTSDSYIHVNEAPEASCTPRFLFIGSLPFKRTMNQQSGLRHLNWHSLSLRAPTGERTPVGREIFRTSPDRLCVPPSPAFKA